jgi:GTP cyclohydrolase II
MIHDLLSSVKLCSPKRLGRPEITLSYAQSLDGSIAVSRGVPCALSGSESRVLTHRLRAAHDAILVGVNTVIADNPLLTVRLAEGPSPLPVVLDSHLRMPLNSNLLNNEKRPLIAATDSASEEKQRLIELSGARVIRTSPDKKGWVDLNSLLEILAGLGIKNIMVEGGARVITSFLSLHLVDRLVITIAPSFLGGLHALESPLNPHNGGYAGGKDLPVFRDIRYEQVGKDIVFWSVLSWPNQ